MFYIGNLSVSIRITISLTSLTRRGPGIGWVRCGTYKTRKRAALRYGLWLALDWWLDRRKAYALRRMTGGSVKAALDALLPAADRFPSQPMIAFNLACYACQLGRLEEAREWLRKAMDVGDEKEIKTRALDDPDLEPLWANIGKL